MRAEATADLLYLYVHDQPVPPVSRCGFGATWSIRINHHQNIHLFLQTEGDSYVIAVNVERTLYYSTTHIVSGPEAISVTAVPDPFRFLNAAMCWLCITFPRAWQPSLQLTILSLNISKQMLHNIIALFSLNLLYLKKSVDSILCTF